MFLGASPIWETWNSGGPFVGEKRANGRVTVDPYWNLAKNESAMHRGRGTWWRDDPETLSEFALATSWVIDSRKRNGARSFQRIRNGEWTYWGSEGTTSVTITPPSTPITRGNLALYLKQQAVAERTANPGLQALPTYDGLPDFPDISTESPEVQTAIGQLTQAGVIEGFPDGLFKPDGVATATQISIFITRLENYLAGNNPGGAVLEVPNVRTVDWDRSIDTDAAECTIVIANTKMKGNNEAQPDPNELGFPGYYTPTRGDSADAKARWPNHSTNPWSGVLMPNVIVRTYEGYGGENLTVKQAKDAGYLRQTGTWLVDRVTVSTDGTITIQARDMARLLIEQFLYPPLVPQAIYEGALRYSRYITLESGEQRSGNYFDYTDIIYDFLLWAGFHYDVFPQEALPDLGGGPTPPAGTAGFAQVHGVLETTGAWAEDALPDDLFDKRPVIDAITEIRNIVGYLFWIDEEGGAHFQSPNWFAQGNWTEDNVRSTYLPEIDERLQITGYSVTFSSENVRTRIVISSEAIPPVPPYGSSAETYAAYKDAISRATFYTPEDGQELWHGMILPAMWWNGAFNDPDEQLIMAKLIAMHLYYRSRQGSLKMQGNPCIQVNDQVRIYERQTSESYVHYVRGVSSTLDNQTGRYEMTLTTHWLGDGNDWAGDRFNGLRIANTLEV